LYFDEIILGHVRKKSIEYKRGMQSGVQVFGFNLTILENVSTRCPMKTGPVRRARAVYDQFKHKPLLPVYVLQLEDTAA